MQKYDHEMKSSYLNANSYESKISKPKAEVKIK